MIRKILYITMIFLLLVSITGFTFYKHYCGGELTGIAFFTDSGECHGTSCNHCEDVKVSSRLRMDMLSTDTQNIPENIHSEITTSDLLPDGISLTPETLETELLSKKATNNRSLSGISILQPFRC